MSTRPAPDRFSAAGEYSRHRQKALSLLARRFPRLQEDERLDIYHAVWASVLEKRRRGERIDNLEAYLMGGIDKRALKRLGRADARRRVSIDPLGDEMSRVADADASPEDRVVLMDELRCTREAVDALEGREGEVIKLRFDLGLTPHEIRTRLGLRERQYRRLIERGTRKVVERVAAAERDGRSRRQLSLFTACLSGLASEAQLAEARALLASDPKARAVLRAMRRSAERAAIALPLPAAGAASAEHARSIGELAASAKQHAISAYVRVSDPTPLSGARPGTVAAAVAGCVAVGGGTYCAVQGVPAPIRPALGIHDEAHKSAREEPVPPPSSPPTPVQAPTPAPSPPVKPAPAPSPVSPPPAPAPNPPPPAPREFFDQPSATQSAEPSTPATPGPSSSGSSEEFAP